MSPSDKLTAAAERIEGAMRPTDDSALPWSRDDLTIITSDGDGHVAEDVYGPDADLIILAVNAMPALAEWLRAFAEKAAQLERIPGAEFDTQGWAWVPAFAIADQILGGE